MLFWGKVKRRGICNDYQEELDKIRNYFDVSGRSIDFQPALIGYHEAPVRGLDGRPIPGRYEILLHCGRKYRYTQNDLCIIQQELIC